MATPLPETATAVAVAFTGIGRSTATSTARTCGYASRISSNVATSATSANEYTTRISNTATARIPGNRNATATTSTRYICGNACQLGIKAAA